jgi:GT2 family glycosyltransferase
MPAIPMITEKIGVVVIGRNEGPRLLRCLASLRDEVNYIVYVDSGSVDGSPIAVGRLGIPVVRLDAARPFTAARARNEGFAALKALKTGIEYVQFIDGDCEIVRGWLGKALAFIEGRKDVAVVCGRRRERRPDMSLYNRLCDLEWNTPVGEALACGGDALMRIDAFEAVSGFCPQLIAYEEPELCMRLRAHGWKIWRLGADMTWHDAAILNFGQWWARTTRSGYGDAQVAQLHARAGFTLLRAIIWGALIPSVIIFGAMFHHPVVLLVALIYPLQVCRIALRKGAANIESWLYGLFVTLAKFAETEGVVKYYWRYFRGQKSELIEYKPVC